MHVTHQPAHPVIITSDMEICVPVSLTNLPEISFPETHWDAERSSPVQRSPAPSLNWRPVVQQQACSAPAPAPSLSSRFRQCPPGRICPHDGCSFQHRTNASRLTQHWHRAHPSTAIPQMLREESHNTRRNTSQARNLCPFENCGFVHNHSVSSLNQHLDAQHAEQQLPELLVLPWQMRACRHCNRIVGAG